jgi:phosphate:Na+ symporter
VDVFQLVLGVLAGLALFLAGLDLLASGFEAIAAERAKSLIARFTSTPLAGVGAGAAACTVLDSSSVTIIMVIAMIESGLMNFEQALGVVMGANVGTTVGSQIIAFEVQRYAAIAMATGLALRIGGKAPVWKRSGNVILGFGMLFFGLDYLGDATAPIADEPLWMGWLASLGEHPLKGAAVGCLFTLVIQSSSATVGMAIALASEALIPLSSGVAIMLGAEVGTVSDTLLATIGRSREAVRTAVFHLLFNLSTAALGLLLIGQLTAFARYLAPASSTGRHLANAHIAFNALGVLLFIGFVPAISRILHWMIPKQERTASVSEREPAESGPVILSGSNG